MLDFDILRLATTDSDSCRVALNSLATSYVIEFK